ncbi:MAG: hypothetical protein A2W91_03495 [Bacteroidetes bacterium GWF2_38_335]|nr:MAG: hypothetical protein A2W91_03495 [Bacteroidetes bacterium GWF2_38_335]OFY77452.1 MAG: hypothetical protein A2281_01265 [Bacteroidetes bacterium RIFOXYA12_FULL_38_20]HBS87259.1 hypothetical protein [Bacteroidales bacterium]
MDNNTFKDSATAAFLSGNFVPVKVNAEKGIGIDLSMKYRLSAFPSFMFLTPDGKVIKKIMGYQDAKTFTKTMNEIMQLHKEGFYYKGISESLKLDYPKFIVDYFKAEKGKKPQITDQVNEYLEKEKDLTTEVNFCILSRFSTSDDVNEKFLADLKKFKELYGVEDVQNKVDNILYSKFKKATSSKKESDLDSVMIFIDKYMPENADQTRSQYQMSYYQSTGQWEKVAEIFGISVKEEKAGNDQINEISWSIYTKCDNKDVIEKAIGWMAGVVEKEPTYAYLDTYAALLFKYGKYEEAKKYAQMAIDAGKKTGEDVKSTEELLKQINEKK